MMVAPDRSVVVSVVFIVVPRSVAFVCPAGLQSNGRASAGPSPELIELKQLLEFLDQRASNEDMENNEISRSTHDLS